MIAESDLNDAVRLVLPPKYGGMGLTAQWTDDFHHCLHCLLTGESTGYYADFGRLDQMRKAFHSGFVYTGEYSPVRGRSHGNSPERVEGSQLVVFSQNHDQIGNRMRGERLGSLVSFEAQKLAAGLVLLAPFLPLLFMGEEYGEDAPFLYFVSHSDPEVIAAVRKGRNEEFQHFFGDDGPPDPQAEETFERSKLRRALRVEDRHRLLWELYRELIGLRTRRPALALLSKKHMELDICGERALCWRRWCGSDEAVGVFHFGAEDSRIEVPVPDGVWKKELYSGDPRWGGARESPERLEWPVGSSSNWARKPSCYSRARNTVERARDAGAGR